MSFRTQILSGGFRALIALAVPLVVCASLQAAVLRVDINVPPGGAGNGTSWPDAFKYLRDALTDPFLAAGDQVWVAQGFYYPDECDLCGPGGTNLRTDSFDVPLEVEVYGGFPTGGGNGTFGARNPAVFETVLSGDIDQDDANSPAQIPGDINGANSFHVLTIVDNDALPPGFFDTIVDGFTITAGNANHATDESLRVGGGAFVVADYIIVQPPLQDGPKFQNCIFVGNRSEDVGGAMACADVGVEVRDCLILNNETMGGQFRLDLGLIVISGGGGIAGVAPFVLVNSRIVGNKCFGKGGGGGVSVRDDADPAGDNVFASCLFAGNEALMNAGGEGGQGGGAKIQTGEVTNCAFIANEADFGDQQSGTFLSGGGLLADGAVDVYLSSFYKNDAPNGGGGGVAFTSTMGSITNSIAWENTDWNNPNGGWREQIFGPLGGPCPTWSNVQGWDCIICLDCATLHNICADPYFSDPDGFDDMLGTEDDHLRLRLDSPSIDKGSDTSPMNLPPDSADVDNDGNTTEELPWDLPGNPRKFDAGVDTPLYIIDQGAYEAQCPACPWDLDGDGTVATSLGSADLLILLAAWGQRCHHADFLEPDAVGTEDLAALMDHSGDCPNCQAQSSSGPSPMLEAATEVMGFAGTEGYGQWLHNVATNHQAEVSLIVLIALTQD